jgi:hypothetical protein
MASPSCAARLNRYQVADGIRRACSGETEARSSTTTRKPPAWRIWSAVRRALSNLLHGFASRLSPLCTAAGELARSRASSAVLRSICRNGSDASARRALKCS